MAEKLIYPLDLELAKLPDEQFWEEAEKRRERSLYWLTLEGQRESLSRSQYRVGQALDSQQLFLEAVNFGERRSFGHGISPLEIVVEDGLEKFNMMETDESCQLVVDPEATEQTRELLRGYPVATIITTMVIRELGVPLDDFLTPADPVDALIQHGETYALCEDVRAVIANSPTQGQAVEGVIQLIENNPSFQEFLTPEGRIARLMEPVHQLIEDQGATEGVLKHMEQTFKEGSIAYTAVKALRLLLES